MKRIQYDQLRSELTESKILLVQGPKNVGKVALVEEVLNEIQASFTLLNCSVKDELMEQIKSAKQSVIVLNNAHKSSSLQEVVEAALNGEISASLVLICSFRPLLDEVLLEVLEANGMLINLFPPTFYEAAQHFGIAEESRLLEERLIYGNYPKVLDDLSFAEVTLRELVQDILITHFGPSDRVNKGDKLLRTMCQLSLSIGEPVSYNEIGELVGLDNETVERYVKLLIDAFVIVALPSYHNEKRYELKKSYCFYFLDNGMRNVLINNMNPTFMRNDMKELWRNYVIAERYKWTVVNNLEVNQYFWRSHTRQQIDLLELTSNGMNAYKTDWEKRAKIKIPELFKNYYPDAKTSLLNKNTYWTFLSKKA
ncbi:MAG: DUF4143 domain-containing protein [Bacteroidetes bacterium]|nr:MAG: DUF4143 domain-containing protein [Bacteroidota bacterium]